jgi:acetyl-CoA acetyltransferase
VVVRSGGVRDVVVAGIYQTRQARRLEGETSNSLTVEAVNGALADAGLSLRDVDGFNVQIGSAPVSNDFAYKVGAPYYWLGRTHVSPDAVVEAALAIAAGHCEVALLSSAQAGLYTDRASTAPWTRPPNEFIETWGLHTPAEWALLAQRHMHLFGTRPEQAAHAAAVVRNNGHVNPEAVYYGRGPFMADDVLASRVVAWPFHLLDCSMTCEGGAAMVLTTAERARDLPGPVVKVIGGGAEQWGPEYTYPPSYERKGMLGRRSADLAFGQAGIARDDVDVLELYDNFSWEIIRAVEAYRYCEPGEGGDFVTSGVIEPGGRLPISTDGGLMSYSHSGGSQSMQRVIQAVRQLRGTSAVNQVADARIALAAWSYSVVLLARD